MKFIPAFAIGLLLNLCTHAQSRAVFNRISVDDAMGLASNRVFCLYQDRKGYIWLGTANGMQRFDGHKFIRFTSSTSNMPMDEVSQIIEDNKGHLWVNFLSRRQFGYYNPSDYTYTPIPLKVSGTIPARSEYKLWKDKKGDIYLNIQPFKILKYDSSQHAFTENVPFQLPTGWKPAMRSFYDQVKDQLYLLSQDSGILIYDYKTKEHWWRRHNPRNIPLLDNWKLQEGITTFYIDKKRQQWIFHWPSWGGGGQYWHCLDSNGNRLPNANSLGSEDVGYSEFHEVYETSKGNIWVSGMNCLYSWDAGENQFYFHKSETEHNYFIQYDVVNQVMEDKDGSLWLATDKGLFFTNSGSNRHVSNIMFDETKGNSNITDILQLRNGDYVITNWDHGVIVLDSKFQKKEHNIYATPVPSNWELARKNAIKLTWSVHQESSTGLLWIGGNGAILNIYDPVKGKSKWLSPPEFNNSTIRTITEDKEGTLWFGTQGGRLIRYDQGKFSVVHELGTIIHKIFIDNSGMVWIATLEKGLYAVNKQNGVVVQHYYRHEGPNSLFANTANDIEQISDSIIVYGAGALNFINKYNGTVKIYDFEDGLPSNTVQRLRVDKQGYLWIMTTSGLCRYNPASKTITPFGRKDGVIFSDLAKDCDYVSRDGFVIFGGENALMFFDPRYMEESRKPSAPVITDVKMFNDYLPLDSLLHAKEVKFPYNQNSLSFYFSSLSYLMNDKMRFYYKLSGTEEDWLPADRNYFVNYSHLPPGKYTFSLFAVNSEGVRSAGTTEFSFFIQPPFWKSAWFILLMIGLTAGLVYLIHRLRINRLIAVQKLRNRVARDLHDDMGSTLSTINILSSMAKSKINTDKPKATEFITKISDNSQRMMEAMDDIVWSIKPSNDSMEKITARMREFATNVLEARNIDLHFKVEPQVNNVKLNMEARRDFFLVFKEAINNAAKYSKASRVDVFITCHNRKLMLLVEDDGVGFAFTEESAGNGMGNMQKRADAMRGRIAIKTQPGEGAKITLTVPIT